MKPLLAIKPAYDQYDAATAAAGKGNFAEAKRLVGEAQKRVPQEGRFAQLLGEIALVEKKPEEAIGHYQRAIELNPDYFGSYLGGGVAQYRAGNREMAQQ
jgi:tetratricopeptide (TPR) repeat protein